MGLTILRKKSYYALGIALVILGIIFLLIVFWRWWVTDVFSSANIFSEMMASFNKSDEVFGLGMGITLLPYAIIGLLCIILGAIILIVRRERVTVTEEVTALLECPICKYKWQEAMAKSHLDSIGYPNVKSLSRHRCPKCAKFIRPRITETKK